MPPVNKEAKLHLTLRGIDLTNIAKGWFAKSSPVYKVCKFSLGTAQLWQPVLTSGRIKDELNPQWPPYTVLLEKLCDCDTDRPIQIHLFDQDANGKDAGSMGLFETTVNTLVRKRVTDINKIDVSQLFTLMENGKAVGKIVVMDARIEEPPLPQEASKPAESTPIKPVAPVKKVREEEKQTSTPAPPAPHSQPAMDQTPGERDEVQDRKTPERVTSARADGKESEKEKEERKLREREEREKEKQRRKQEREEQREKEREQQRRKLEETKLALDPDAIDANSVLRLRLEGVDMVNVEGWMGCSDPFYDVKAPTISLDGSVMWQRIYRSEHLENTLNPVWNEAKIDIDYLCQCNLDQEIRIFVFDWEGSKKHNPMGYFDTSVNGLLERKAKKNGDKWDTTNAFIPKTPDGKEMGKIVVADAFVEQRKGSSAPPTIEVDETSILTLTLEGIDMANVEGWGGCSDPFFEILGPVKDPTGGIIWQRLHRSEYLENNLNPRWDPINVELDLVCQGDINKPIRISIFDWEQSGKHNPMGFFETTVQRLIRSKAEKIGDKWDTVKAFITESEDGEEFGKIVVVDAVVKSAPIDTSKTRRKSLFVPKVDHKSMLLLTLEGVDMANIAGWFGCTNPFYQVSTSAKTPRGLIDWQIIHRSEHIDNNLNPRWEQANINIELLCSCDLDKLVRFSFFNWDEKGKHQPMGLFHTSVNRLLRSKAKKNDGKWDITKAFITESEGQEFGKIVVVDASIDSFGRNKRNSVLMNSKLMETEDGGKIPWSPTKNGSGSPHSPKTDISPPPMASIKEALDLSESWTDSDASFGSDGKAKSITSGPGSHRSQNSNPSGEDGQDSLAANDNHQHGKLGAPHSENSTGDYSRGRSVSNQSSTSQLDQSRSRSRSRGRVQSLSPSARSRSRSRSSYGSGSRTPSPRSYGPESRSQSPHSYSSRSRGRSQRSDASKPRASLSPRSYDSGKRSPSPGSDGSRQRSRSRSDMSQSRSLSPRSYGSRSRSQSPRSYSSRSRSLSPQSYASTSKSPSGRSYDSRSKRPSGGSYDSESETPSGHPHASRSKSPSGCSHDSRSKSPSRHSYEGRSYASRSSSPSGRSYSSRSRRSGSARSYSSHSYASRSFDSKKPASTDSHASRLDDLSRRTNGEMQQRSVRDASQEEVQHVEEKRNDIAGKDRADSMFHLTLKGIKLTKAKGWFGGKNDPFFQVSAHAIGTSQMWQPVYISESVQGETSPQWKTASVSLNLLCGGDLEKRVQLSVLDYDKTGKHTSMGSIITTVQKLIDSKVGGFGSGENYDGSKMLTLSEDGKELGKIVVLNAHADSLKPKTPVSLESVESQSTARNNADASIISDERSRSSRSSRKQRRYSEDSAGNKSSASHRDSTQGSRSDYSSEVSVSDESGASEEDEDRLYEDAKFHLTLYGVDFAKGDGLFERSDPFYQIAARTGSKWRTLYTSEHVQGYLNPKWKPVVLKLEVLCKRDLDQPIQIAVFDREENEEHRNVGFFETSVNGLLEAKVLIIDKEDIDTSKAFRIEHNGLTVGKVIVAGARIEQPSLPASRSVGSGVGTSRDRKKKRSRPKKKKEIKFNNHGDELSIGTIDSETKDKDASGGTKNIFGDMEEDEGQCRPWKEALPAKKTFDPDMENFAIGAEEDGDGESKEGSITNIAEILARVEDADDSEGSGESDDSDESDDEDREDEEEDSEKGSDDEGEKKKEKDEESEKEAMLEMMTSMQQSFSVMAGEGMGRDGADLQVDLEKFDEMYDTVAVNETEVAEFLKKMEERARRKKKQEEEDNDPDLLRDTPRLILFESEKESKKKKGKKKKKGDSKFSKEFLEAIRQVFGDSDAEDSGIDEEEEKEEAKVIVSRSPSMATSRRASDGSLFVGSDMQSESKEEMKVELEDNLKKLGGGETDSKYSGDEDDLTKSRRSLMSNMSKSIRSIKDIDSSASPGSKKRSPRKLKPKVDPAQVFAEEMKKQENLKFLSTSVLKQEMADMKRGMSRKMMERELANLKKATANKFSPFEEQKKSGPSLFEDYNTGKSSYRGVGAADRPERPKAPPARKIGGGTGLGELLARNEANQDTETMRLDDLATVALADDSKQLPNLTNLNLSQAGAAKNAKKKKPTPGLGSINETGGAGSVAKQGDPFVGGGQGNGWENPANGKKASGAQSGDLDNTNTNTNNPGIKEKIKFKAPKFSFGKKKGGGGVQLDDDDGGGGGLLSNY